VHVDERSARARSRPPPRRTSRSSGRAGLLRFAPWMRSSATTSARRPQRTTSDCARELCAHSCLAPAQQLSEAACPAHLVLVRSRRATHRHSSTRVWTKASAGRTMPSPLASHGANKREFGPLQGELDSCVRKGAA
jgi:hypothetical protein